MSLQQTVRWWTHTLHHWHTSTFHGYECQNCFTKTEHLIQQVDSIITILLSYRVLFNESKTVFYRVSKLLVVIIHLTNKQRKKNIAPPTWLAVRWYLACRSHFDKLASCCCVYEISETIYGDKGFDNNGNYLTYRWLQTCIDIFYLLFYQKCGLNFFTYVVVKAYCKKVMTNIKDHFRNVQV